MITLNDYIRDRAAFEELWAKYGGDWSVTWADGMTILGFKKPDRPKLKLIQGGKL